MLLSTQDDFDVVYEEADGLKALEALVEQSLDLVLVDNRIHSISGAELIRRFLRRNLDGAFKSPHFVLTGPFDSPGMALEAIRCGATYMVSEEVEPEEFLKALRQAGAMEQRADFARLSEFFAEQGIEHGSNTRWLLRLNNLEDAEQVVLDRLGSGTPAIDLDETTGLTKAKVRWCLDSLQERLALATRAQLALALYEAGLLPAVGA